MRSVLLDLNVPIINGFEILERVKNDKKLKRIPVIILSGSSNDDDIERCYQAGANCYLCKPGGLTEFFDMVTQLVKYWLVYAKIPTRPAAMTRVS